MRNRNTIRATVEIKRADLESVSSGRCQRVEKILFGLHPSGEQPARFFLAPSEFRFAVVRAAYAAAHVEVSVWGFSGGVVWGILRRAVMRGENEIGY